MTRVWQCITSVLVNALDQDDQSDQTKALHFATERIPWPKDRDSDRPKSMRLVTAPHCLPSGSMRVCSKSSPIASCRARHFTPVTWFLVISCNIRSCNRLEINIFKHHVWCICSCKWQELRMMPFQQEVLQWKTAKPLAVALQINRKMKNLPVSRNVCECIIVQLQNTPGLNSVDFFSATVFEQFWTAWAAKISDSGTDMPNTLNTARSVRVTPSSWEDVHLVDQEPAPLRSRILEILQVQLQLFTTTSTWYLPDWVPVTYLACWSHPGMTIIINVPIVAPRKPTTLATSLTFTNKKKRLLKRQRSGLKSCSKKIESDRTEGPKGVKLRGMIQRYQKNLKDLQLQE